jgi:hypothetical protein
MELLQNGIFQVYNNNEDEDLILFVYPFVLSYSFEFLRV